MNDRTRSMDRPAFSNSGFYGHGSFHSTPLDASLSPCTSQVPPIFSDTPRSHLSQPPNVTNEYERLRLQQESCNSQMKDIVERLVTMESHLKEITNSVHPPEPQHTTSSAGSGRIPPVISVSQNV